jgi:ribosomal protein S12 methylthiotransferase accessory factor
MVHTDYTLPLPAGSGSFLISSNGLASGNSFEEAVSHGLCELIERDATTLHGLGSAGALADRRVDVRSIDDGLCQETIQRFERAGVAVAVTDVTSDVGVAAFRCDVADKEGESGGLPPLRGTGCHPRREIALLRALNEAAQTRLTMISGSRDDLSPWWYADRDRVEQSRRRFFEELRYPALRDFAQAPHFDGETLGDDLAWLVARLRAVGFDQVCVADLTRPELGVPVARVIVPGLEAMAEAPGYLRGERAQRRLRERQ